MNVQTTLGFETRGRGTLEITGAVQDVVAGSGVRTGLCHVFIHHTSASLMLCENADPVVREDLERLMQRLVPDGDPMFRHVAEGDDDMPAHGRTLLTHGALSLPVTDGRCALGTWQGLLTRSGVRPRLSAAVGLSGKARGAECSRALHDRRATQSRRGNRSALRDSA